MPKTANNQESTNRLLAGTGGLFAAMALLGLILNRSGALVGGLAVVAAGLLLIAVLAPRMKGKVKLGFGGIELNLTELKIVERAAATAEQEVVSGAKLLTLDELAAASQGEAVDV